MHALPEDLRLLITVLLNALVVVSASRFIVRRHIRDWPQVVLDAMLIWYIVQYLSVALPGVLGVLSAGTMMLTAIVIGIALIVAPRSRVRPEEPTAPISAIDRRVVLACLGIVLSLVAAHIFHQRLAPPSANDALTYHLPAAATWLQTGRLTLFETWFFNPANTYSPLAGSTFIAWLIAPMDSDILARGVETPALVMIFFVLLQLCRALGASTRVAAIIALAACCSRPLVNQVFLAKDDLFVAAFFGASVVAMTRVRLYDPLGPIRLGIAVGLLLATKYTAMLCLPILLLMFSPREMRRYTIAGAVTLVLAGPWYLRNWIVTGNPVFPIDFLMFPGIFTPARSEALTWKTFTGYSGLPVIPLVVLVAMWLIAIVRSGARIKSDPLARTVALGPPIMIGLFVAISPYAEVRFIYPAVVLMFAACAIVATRWVALAVLLACLMIGTSFIPQSLWIMKEPAIGALIVFALVVIAIERRSLALSALLAFIVGAFTYAYWPGYVKQYRGLATDFWTPSYGKLAEAWKFVRDDTPSGATIAYANTYFVYPLMGADRDRRVIYAPTRAGVKTIADLGKIDEPLPGERIVERVAQLTTSEPGRSVWIENLRTRSATYLFIAKPRAGASEPPELEFARKTAGIREVFENPAATIFAIDSLPSP